MISSCWIAKVLRCHRSFPSPTDSHPYQPENSHVRIVHRPGQHPSVPRLCDKFFIVAVTLIGAPHREEVKQPSSQVSWYLTCWPQCLPSSRGSRGLLPPWGNILVGVVELWQVDSFPGSAGRRRYRQYSRVRGRHRDRCRRGSTRRGNDCGGGNLFMIASRDTSPISTNPDS